MILSCYTDEKKNVISLTLELDENYFPKKYIVTHNGGRDVFPGTKAGAREAKRYYNNFVSVSRLSKPGGV